MTGSTTARRLALAAIILGMMAALALSGVLRSFENTSQNLAASFRERPASGQLHVVEMDAASVAAIDRWPWPRSHYARIVDTLDAAGVRSIVFDVDFSTPSTPAEDRALAEAFARAEAQIVVPTFAQQASFESDRRLDALPIEVLRPYASLASVSVRPDSDGLVRQMPMGTVTQGQPRPSLSAQIARRSGSAGDFFPIDFGIEPDTLPRHSFISIANDRFDPAELRGRDVLVGATAIEMGDRYTVPRHGVLPGVIVQALAAETLYAGIPVQGGWVVPLLLAGSLAVWILAASTRPGVAVRAAVALSVLALGVHLAFALGGALFELIPALGALALASLVRTGLLIREEIEERRCHDPDSGLPNARGFARHASPTDGNYTVAATIEGYEALRSVLGDEAMGQLANRLAERLQTGASADRVYRVSDRFFAWNTTADRYELEDALSGLRALMRSPVEIGGRQVDVTLWFGIAEAGALAGATHASSLAARDGVAWRYHERAGQEALEQEISLMGELDAAIERSELAVLYQPKLDIASGKVASVEALVRWEHPVRGPLRPDSFIPMAEQNDRIADLTHYVLERTLEDLRAWNEQGLTLKAAVNISARLVASQAFLQRAENAIRQSAVPFGQVIFEVTESATMADPDRAIAALRRFRELGITISMDDYGTGQSSLTYLQKLPLSELKIDRSFVQHAHRERSDALLVHSTVQLAHSLGLRVVAEGVEDEECLDFLRGIECDYAQGYLIGKPMSAAQLSATTREFARKAA